MKWLILCGMPVIVGGGLYMHGPVRGGDVYARPASEVAQTLELMALPPAIGDIAAMVPSFGSTRVAVPGKSVTYFFQARGAQAGKFVAEIDAVDATHTRVTTRMEMADDADKLLKSPLLPTVKAFETVGTAAMNEQIDSRLERRPYDDKVAERAMAGYAIANMGAIQRSVSQQMDEAAAVPRDRVHPAKAEVRFEPGRPMVDTDTDER